MNEIEETLAERKSRYGKFEFQAEIEQNIKRVFNATPNWKTLPDDSKSSLEMIATKLSRILYGDPNYADSWHDLAGYAQLIVKRIEEELNGN